MGPFDRMRQLPEDLMRAQSTLEAVVGYAPDQLVESLAVEMVWVLSRVVVSQPSIRCSRIMSLHIANLGPGVKKIV